MAEAGELNLGAETDVGYDSNLFNRGSNNPAGEIDTASITLRVRGQVQDELERGEYKLSYSPAYTINTAREAKNTWNQAASFAGTYHFSPRTQLTFREDFAYLEKIVFSPDEPPPGAPPSPAADPDISDQNRRSIRNVVGLSGTHLLSPRWQAYGGGSFSIYRFSRSTDRQSDGISGYLGTSYRFTEQLNLGVGGSTSYRSFAGTQTSDLQVLRGSPPVAGPFCFESRGPRSRTINYSAFGSFGYQFDETASISMKAGPARIESEFSQCAPVTGLYQAGKGAQTTWFAEGELLKRWERVKSSLRYRRQQGLVSGATTTITDSAVARVDWEMARFWSFGVRGGWIRRSTANGSAATTWTASARLSRRFLRRLRANVTLSYRLNEAAGNAQMSGGSLSSGFDTWRVFAGVQYDFDPIRF